ncbi:MAG: thioether cross-link-forming SCIFF peptide maturase, partial [bacterium]|nr:thioether cross-link-forming SCIFF peptide maturase [bacterium]
MVHKFCFGPAYIAIDVYSGAIHILDKISYDLMDFTGENMGEKCPGEAYTQLPQYTKEELDECYRELYDLYKQGMLHATDMYNDI